MQWSLRFAHNSKDGIMNTVGFIGWRGMVGSVLMQRMQSENDFADIEPVFFSTSQVERRGPISAGRCRHSLTPTISMPLLAWMPS